MARKQASDYAMALDAMAKITNSGSEKEAIENILELFEMLFIPGTLYYVSLENGEPQEIYSLSPLLESRSAIRNRIDILKGKYAWTKSQKGFQARIAFQGTDFGILEVDNVQFPEHRRNYLNLTLSITDVCGLAIENARKHQAIKNAENKLRLEKAKLEQALAQVKTLSGLLPICSHCKKIRDDQGYWNQIEKYVGEHSNAQFSHGICPECAKKFYPDFYIYDDEQSR